MVSNPQERPRISWVLHQIQNLQGSEGTAVDTNRVWCSRKGLDYTSLFLIFNRLDVLDYALSLSLSHLDRSELTAGSYLSQLRRTRLFATHSHTVSASVSSSIYPRVNRPKNDFCHLYHVRIISTGIYCDGNNVLCAFPRFKVALFRKTKKDYVKEIWEVSYIILAVCLWERNVPACFCRFSVSKLWCCQWGKISPSSLWSHSSGIEMSPFKESEKDPENRLTEGVSDNL